MSKTLTLLLGLTSVAVAITAGAGCSQALAQDPPPQPDSRRTISVSGSGSVRVKPDIASAVIGSSKSAVKLPDAKREVDASMNQIKSALKKAGVADEEIQTTNYQIYRVQANPQAGIRETVWKVVHMVMVRTKKPDSIASIVDAAVAAGATDINSIDFSVDSLAKYRVKARELAVAAATEKAKQLADLTHVNLGRVISVSEQADLGYQRYQMASNEMADFGGGRFGSGITGGQIEVGTTTAIVFEIR